MLKIAWAKEYDHPLKDGHRFPMAKYSLLPQQLLYEGTITEQNLFNPIPITEEEVLHTHTKEYWLKLKYGTLSKKEERRIGFPYNKSLVDRELLICGGTIQNAIFALEFGCSINVAGGTHHAYADKGEGFCLLNDIAIAGNYILRNGLIQKILVVDLDVHQGNGTAKLFEDKIEVVTFSMHGASNYPLRKEKSDVDVALPDNISDYEYLNILGNHLNSLIVEHSPDFIFYQAGVDVLESDKLGKLGLTIYGCKERDKLVFEACKSNNLPVAVTMGGGYSERLKDIVEAHANTYRLAQDIFF